MKSQRVVASFLIVGVTVIALALAGCSSSSGQSMGSAPASAPKADATQASSSMAKAGSSTAKGAMAASDMPCGPCATKGQTPVVNGTVKTVDGVQVVEIGIKDEAYTPNVFAAKAGAPIKVVFTGKASACLAKPTFPKLNKSTNLGATGSGTIDLGALTPGTYELTCGMGSHGGNLVVQ